MTNSKTMEIKTRHDQQGEVVKMNKHQEAMLLQAIKYARRGWHILPCRKDKKPYNQNGSRGATTDEEQIMKWWDAYPNANIGVATGKKSGFFVIDIDIKNDRNGMETLERTFGEELTFDTDRDMIQKTPSGGFHLLYQCGDREVHNSQTNTSLPGIDIRGEGGYILVSPSSVNIDGNWIQYELKNKHIPEPYPWVEKLLGMFNHSRGKLDVVKVITGLTEGERDDGLFRFAAMMNVHGVPYQLAEAFVLQAAARCTPPFDQCDAIEKVKSGYSYDHSDKKHRSEHLVLANIKRKRKEL
jgi:putative DNA primase/helicase